MAELFKNGLCFKQWVASCFVIIYWAQDFTPILYIDYLNYRI
ncbi:10837_t:CDS:1, partial [Diversispora eburnea]